MKLYRIAQIGTFDYENMGDLLFPIILEKAISRDGQDIIIEEYSPIGGIMPFFPEREVYPISSLEERHRQNPYDAIVIGGGDLIRLDTIVASSEKYRVSDGTLWLWVYPIILGLLGKVPVLFNAPGVPFAFAENQYGTVRSLMQIVDYASVRDEESRKLLMETGYSGNIQVVPDTITLIAELFPKDTLPYQSLRQKVPGQEKQRYACFQLNALEEQVGMEAYAEAIRLCHEEMGCDIYLMPIGYVHDDVEVLRSVYEYVSIQMDFVYLIEEKLTPFEMVALIAGARCFIGTSLHGSVISYAYGVPMVAVNPSGLTKVNGFYQMIDMPERVCGSIAELKNKLVYLKGVSVLGHARICQGAWDHLHQLFGRIRIGQKQSARQLLSLMECIPVGREEAFTSAIYWSGKDQAFSQERFAFLQIKKKRGHRYTFNRVELPEGTCCVRLDPCDGFSYAVTANAMAVTDIGEFELTPVDAELQGGYAFFATSDPQLILRTERPISWLMLSADILPLNQKPNTAVLCAAIYTCAQLREGNTQLQIQLQKKEEIQAQLQQMNAQLNESNREQVGRIEEQSRIIEQLTQANAELNEGNRAQRIHAEEQERLIEQLTQANAELNEGSHAQRIHAEEQERLIEQLTQANAELNEGNRAQRIHAEEQSEIIKRLTQTNAQLNEENQIQRIQAEEQNSIAERLRTDGAQLRAFNEQLNAENQKRFSESFQILQMLAQATDQQLAPAGSDTDRAEYLEAMIRQAEYQAGLIRSQRGALRMECENANRIIALMEQSFSWRITAPLRQMGRAIRGVLGVGKPTGEESKLVRGIRYWKHHGFKRTVMRLTGGPQPVQPVDAEEPVRIDSTIWPKDRSRKTTSFPMIHGGEPEIKQIDKEVSVVIPTKNGGTDFKRLMQWLSLQQGFRQIEIVIVDSGSTDNTVSIARHFGAKVISIRPDEFTHSYARNLGVQNASGDYVLVMTQDAMPTSRYWIYNMYQALEREPNVGAISCGEYPRADADLYHRAFTWHHYRYIKSYENDVIKSMPPTDDIESKHSAAQLSDIACFMEMSTARQYPYRGGFAEDLDLGMRLLEDGKKVGFLGHELAIHSHNRTAYYYLRRRHVELLTFKKIFQDQQIIPYTYDAVVKEAVYVASCLTDFFTYDSLAAETQMIPYEQFKARFMQAYHGMFQGTFSHTITFGRQIDWLDEQTYALIADMAREYSAHEYPEEPYSGSLLPAIEGYLQILFNYMAECYEVVNQDVIAEFKECIGKIYAGALGTFFAYSKLSDSNDAEIHKDFYQEIGRGV